MFELLRVSNRGCCGEHPSTLLSFCPEHLFPTHSCSCPVLLGSNDHRQTNVHLTQLQPTSPLWSPRRCTSSLTGSTHLVPVAVELEALEHGACRHLRRKPCKHVRHATGSPRPQEGPCQRSTRQGSRCTQPRTCSKCKPCKRAPCGAWRGPAALRVPPPHGWGPSRSGPGRACGPTSPSQAALRGAREGVTGFA